MLTKLQKKIYKLLPELKTIVKCNDCNYGVDVDDETCDFCLGCGEFIEYKTIRLSDVLRALKTSNGNLATDRMLDNLLGNWYPAVRWDLKKDLSEQSDKTKEWINIRLK